MKFKKNEVIEFITTVEGLDKIEECLPRPSKHYIPKWFKDIPSTIPGTVKQCPSFPDYFSMGYIIPMWCDVILDYEKQSDTWSWQYSSDKFQQIENHPNKQFLNLANPSFLGIDGQFVFKFVSPWKIITPPGWSVLQLPLFYNFNKDWSVLPGVIDTDIYHDINQQVLYYADGRSVEIKCGEPFAMYLPFKRSDKLDSKISLSSDEQNMNFKQQHFELTIKSMPNGTYRKWQRQRDKK